MEIPKNYKFTKDHEWVKVDGVTATIGISEFAQSELGEIVFLELPVLGKTVKQRATLCVVESTKAASDVYAPIGGVVKEVNSALSDTPGTVNTAPYTDGWMVKIEGFNSEELKGLMSADEYVKILGEHH